MSRGAAFNGGGTAVSQIDPLTGAETSIGGHIAEVRAIAIDANGDIYGHGQGLIRKFDRTTLSIVGSIGTFGGDSDIDISLDGQTLVVASHGGEVGVADSALTTFNSWQTRVSNGVNFAAIIQLPVGISAGGNVFNSAGVLITGTGTQVTSTGGTVTINGHLEGGTDINRGVEVSGGATVSAQGVIDIDGSTDGTSNTIGVLIMGSGTEVTSIAGNITIDGTSAGTGANNSGIHISSTALGMVNTTANVTLTSTDGITTEPGVSVGTHVQAAALTINGNLSPGGSPGQFIAQSNLNLMGGFELEVNGLNTAGSDYDQVVVMGGVHIDTAAILSTSGIITGTALNDVITMISNDGADLVTGQFSNLTDGATLNINGEDFRIFYNGGDGNDVVLVADHVVTAVYVNDDFTSLSAGTFIADADPHATGDQVAIFGVSA